MRILALLLFAFPAWGVDYYVSPAGGTAWPNCTSVGSPCTLAAANSGLTAGDTAYMLAGSYPTQIRPANSGTSNDSRIVYRAYGDGDVNITVSPNQDNNFIGQQLPEGAISLNDRDYVTVSGRANGDPITSQRIRVVLAIDNVQSLGGMCGSEGSILENVYLQCPSNSANCSRGFGICINYWLGNYESRYNIIRDSFMEGNTDPDGDAPNDFTEDFITIAHNAHHNIIERNVIGKARHDSLYADSTISYANIIRNNIVDNFEHTAISIWSAGTDLADDARFLIENNIAISSGLNTAPDGNEGNAFQWGSSELIVRYNVFTESGQLNFSQHNASISGIAGSTSFSFGAAYTASDTRLYNNTVVKNSGAAVAVMDFGADGVDLGRNTFTNNIFYDSYSVNNGEILLEYWQGFDTGLDKYRNNIFGNLGQPASQNILNVGSGTVSLATAISNYTNPTNPQFIQWEGFDNVWDNAPGFVDYNGDDYELASDSDAVDAGSPLAVVVGSGTGTLLQLDDSRWFYSECGEFPAWMNVECDVIAVGATLATADIVQITGTDDANDTVALENSIDYVDGDYVWLYRDSDGNLVISGGAPDIGAFEYQQAQATPEIPTGVNVVIVP